MALRKRSFIVLGFSSVVLLAACGGKIVDIGGQSTSQQITPSAVTVAESSCGSGYEHSNICCTGGDKDTTPTCESWPDSPFHPCPDGWTTYPNAAQCCSLSNPADCSSCGDTGSSTPPSTGVDNGPNQPVGTPTTDACGPTSISPPEPIDAGPYTGDGGIDYNSCDSRCPPGYTGISPYDPQGCCQHNSDGSSECFGEARATPDYPPDASTTTEDASTDAGSAPDGGTNGGDPGFGGGSGGSDPTTGVCDISCPDGWFLADAADGVCCNNGSGGDEECFAVVFPGDNGGGGPTTVSGGSDGSNGSGAPIDAGSAPSH